MYCQEVVDSRLEVIEKIVGFRPEYHTPEEVADFNLRLEYKYADFYAEAKRASQGVEEPTKPFQIVLLRRLCNPQAPVLNSDEVRFMTNERAMCMCDAAYFLTRYYWILNRENILQLFTFQSGQKILFNCIAEMERLGFSIEILLAKARQLGMTTVVAGLLLLKAMLGHGVKAVVASADRAKTREMVEKIILAYDRLPWWLRPLYSKRVASDAGALAFGSLESALSFQHGNQVNPIAMGSTVIGYHLSEVSSYNNARKLIEIGLFKAVHPSRRVLGILESTCKGDTGWWHDSYWDAKKNWIIHASRLMALFLPFPCAEDMYPNPTERIGHPTPDNWRMDQTTREMVAECEMYIASNPVLAKVMSKDGKPWQMSREQAWYWEWNFLSARAKGSEKQWYQEMPHTDRAAFQGSYENVFGKDVIAQCWTNRAQEGAYETFAIIGQSIEDRHEPSDFEIDDSLVRVPILWSNKKDQLTYRWELVPLTWAEPFRELAEIREDDEDHMGKFFRYRPPEPGYDYSIGCDTSSGLGGDGTAICVSRRARHPQDIDIQVAEFRDNFVSHVEAYAWMAAIGAHYSKYMTPEHHCPTRHRMPYMAIEQIAAVGDTCQLQLRKMGFRRFHQMIRYDSKPEQMRKFKAHKQGWFTYGWSRPILCDTFTVWVQNGWYQVNSPFTLWEMDHWEVHYTSADKVKYEHGEDTTDDGLFACAMSAFCPNDLKPMSERTTKRSVTLDNEGKYRAVIDMTPTPNGYTVPSKIPRNLRPIPQRFLTPSRPRV